jgi:hypothetical protein
MNFAEFLKYMVLIIIRPNSTKTMEWRMLKLLNRDRKNAGLKPVRMQGDLREVARRHSKDMARKDYFDHVNLKSQSPSDRLKIAGVSDVVSGENLAKIGGYPNPTQKAEIGLMNSPGHKANILNPLFNTVGIGVIHSENGVYFFTQNFASRSLVFKTTFPKSAKISKGIRVKGEVSSRIAGLIYQIRISNTDIILDQSKVTLSEKKFDFTLKFKEKGKYDVFFYVDKEGFGRYELANSSSVRVKRRFFD